MQEGKKCGWNGCPFHPTLGRYAVRLEADETDGPD